MDAAGWAKASMTGKKLSFAFKGKRSVGDEGNDYIAGLAWKFGQDVMTKFEWKMVSGAKLACDVVVNLHQLIDGRKHGDLRYRVRQAATPARTRCSH